ncbi:hypothetical protein POM88_013848 [Heracleum sosnowskyi]|uniref:Uncharacterized protein n=1 Tax=Heracleum sosnowskyi TaxID=360622 RepID=A0AAD8IZC0_9APIA|nr:hypothetical protein POM88_013848 [Heracleum sosnowskyi]
MCLDINAMIGCRENVISGYVFVLNSYDISSEETLMTDLEDALSRHRPNYISGLHQLGRLHHRKLFPVWSIYVNYWCFYGVGCCGLGFVQQMKSERDDDKLTAERLRIEELEVLAASRQKEIFMLNTRLATAESITHYVLRDLLGLKLDITGYVQVQKITEKAQLHNTDVQNKDQEATNLKEQLTEFVVERKRSLEEID